jgi:transaldolase
MLRGAYDESDGRDGFVSFECTPDLADETRATIAQATELWGRIDRPNGMIKVPATEAGIPAIEELTARGVNVNITLLFSLARYKQVIDAYIAGLERRLAAGKRVDGISSVASFFVSRVDAKADPLLPAGSDLRGRVAIANAHRAYARYRERFADQRWIALREAGAAPQRPRKDSSGPAMRDSTSLSSRRNWNARECAPSATPTTNYSTASRQGRRGSRPRAGMQADTHCSGPCWRRRWVHGSTGHRPTERSTDARRRGNA